MTFASVTADHSANLASSKRIVSARIVMPIIGAIELRDLLTQLIDALTEQGVITSEAPVANHSDAARTAPLKATRKVRHQSKLSVSRRGLMTPDAVVCSATAAESALICVAPAFTAALSTAR
jgi:hypothetical protein